MKRTISILTIAALFGAALNGCNTAEENEAPTVTIIAPSADNNPHMSGQSIHIHVEFADDEELHEAMVSIVRQHDGTEVYHHHVHEHSTAVTVMEDTVLTTIMHSDFVVTATVTDHDGETTTDTETFHMHPM